MADYLQENTHRFATPHGDEYLYTLNAEGEACIVRCASLESSVDIPGDLDGHVVTSIAELAFAGLDKPVSISGGPNVRTIGHRAFSRCARLKRVLLPNHLTALDETWFMDSRQIDEVALPSDVEEVPSRFFKHLHPLRLFVGKATKSIAFPDGWSSCLREFAVDSSNPFITTDGVNLYTHDGETLIASVVHGEEIAVAEGCRAIGPRAFAYNTDVKRVKLPDSLEAIGQYAFLGSGLESFEAPQNLRSIGDSAFLRCKSLAHVNLNEGLESIGESAFSNCTSLAKLAVPATVSDLGKRVLDNTPLRTRWSDEAFSIDKANKALRIDKHGALYTMRETGWELTDIYNPDLRNYRVSPDTVTIGDAAFQGHARIETVELPEGLTRIGRNAFKGCLNLYRLSLPETLVSIGEYALFNTMLQQLVLPASLVELGEAALGAEHREGIGDVNQPPAFTGLSVAAGNPRFYLENALLCGRYENGTVRALLYVGPEPNVEIPLDVTEIGPYAFGGATTLRQLKIHRNVRTIGTWGLNVDRTPAFIDIDTPLFGNEGEYLRVVILQDRAGLRAMRNAFVSGKVNVRTLLEDMDIAALHSCVLAQRACYLVRRLMDPHYMTEDIHGTFASEVRTHTKNICLYLAEANWPQGYDYLVDLGYLTQVNITPIIDAVSDAGFVAMTAYLMALKDARFGADDDYSL